MYLFIFHQDVGKIGTVVHFFPNGSVGVLMNDSPRFWSFNQECLTFVKRAPFNIGDTVRIKDMDTEEMERLQEPHGGWVPLMEDVSKVAILTVIYYNLKGLSVIVNSKLHFFPNPQIFFCIFRENFTVMTYLWGRPGRVEPCFTFCTILQRWKVGSPN